MSGSDGGNASQRIALIADICGIVSVIGIVVISILRAHKIINLNDARQPLVIGVIAATVAGLTLLVQGFLIYFRRIDQFQRKSPWLDLVLGVVMLLIALGGWQAT